MKKLKEAPNDLQKSLVTETEYLPVGQGFDISIGFSEKIVLPNADQLIENEYKRDLQIYKKLKEQQMHKQREAMRKNKPPTQLVDAATESVNEFLAIDPNSKPSKWKKPEKSQLEQSSQQQLIASKSLSNDTKQLKGLDVPMGESVKVTDSVAQACKNSDVKLGKWSKPRQAVRDQPNEQKVVEVNESLKASSTKKDVKKSRVLKARPSKTEKVETGLASVESLKESVGSVHLDQLQTSATTQELSNMSSMAISNREEVERPDSPNISHIKKEETDLNQDSKFNVEGSEHLDHSQEQVTSQSLHNIDNEEEDAECQQEGSDEEPANDSESDSEQDEEQEDEEQEQQEDEEEEDEQEDEEEEQEDQEQDEQQEEQEDGDEGSEENAVDSSQPITVNQHKAEHSVDVGASNHETNTQQSLEESNEQSQKIAESSASKPSKWNKPTNPLEGSDPTYNASNYLPTTSQEQQWKQAQGVIRGLQSLLD